MTFSCLTRSGNILQLKSFFFYHLDYGNLSYSGVPVSHTLSYLWRPVTTSKLTAKNMYFFNKLSTAHFKIEMQRGCFYMNVFLKITDRLLQKSFDVLLI